MLPSSKTIHVGNLNSCVSAEMLRQIFGCIGSIVDVRVSAEGRYGFVDFVEAEAATASLAMHGTVVCGAPLRVQRATQPKVYGNQAVPPPMPMLAQLQNGAVAEFTALAGVTSPAALAALARQATDKNKSSSSFSHNKEDETEPSSNLRKDLDPKEEQQNVANYAFMNPAQQRAALEARHREMVAKSVGGWGVSRKRHDSDDSDSSRSRRHRRKRSRSPSRHRSRRRHQSRHDHHRRSDRYLADSLRLRSRSNNDDEPHQHRRKHRDTKRTHDNAESHHLDDDDDDDHKGREEEKSHHHKNNKNYADLL